jgi:tetratricopeptide (TPR) repeat protein
MTKKIFVILMGVFLLLAFNKSYATYGEADSINYYYVKAQNFFSQKKFDSCLYLANKAIELDSQNAQIYLLRGNAQNKIGEYHKAIEDFSKAIGFSGDKALLESSYFGRGIAETKLQLYQKAIEDFSVYNKSDPTSIVPLVNRAYCYILIKNPDLAIADLTKAEKFSPTSSIVAMFKGDAYVLKNNSDSAYFFFDKSISFDLNNYTAYKSKANILLNKNEMDKAKIEIDKALKLKKNYYDGYAVLGAIYIQQNNLVEARNIVDVMISISPELPMAYFLLAKIYFIQEDYTKALKSFDLSTSKGGNYAETYYYRGQSNEALRNYTLAISDYLMCYKWNSTFVGCLTYAGHCYEMLGDNKRAEECYNTAVSVAPKYKNSLLYRGNFLYAMHRFAEAKTDLSNLLLIDSLNYDIYIKLSRIELVFHDYEKSLEYCNKGISIFELKDKAHFNVELYVQRLITYIFLSRYDLVIKDGDLIKKRDNRLDTEIDVLKTVSYFYLNKYGNFKSTINSYSNEAIVSNYQLIKLKLFSLLVDNNYNSWVDLYYYYCLSNQMEYTSFDLYNPVVSSDSGEIKVIIRKDYVLSKSIDSAYTIGFSLGFITDSTIVIPIYEKLIKAIDSKILENVQYKEILYLIRGQLNKELCKADALNDFNRAIEINGALPTSYYLRAKYKENILKDNQGASDDYSKAQLLYKLKGL